MGIIDFFAGSITAKVPSSSVTDLFNICMRYELSIEGLGFDEKHFYFRCSMITYTKIATSCRFNNIKLEPVKKSGLPSLLFDYKNRVGLLIGLTFAILVVIFSGRFLWGIEVDGNVRMTDEAIKTILSENGIEVGKLLKSLDVGNAENSIMLENEDIAWISVNISGNVASVEVRETEKKQGLTGNQYANLVARCDGEIELAEVFDGNSLVKIGDVVKKGDILVSGVYETSPAGIRYSYSRGKIFAKTVHEITVKIPFEVEQKVYTGREWTEKYIKFFSNNIKVFSNSRKTGECCDIIYSNDMLRLFGKGLLPVGTGTVRYLEYEMESCIIDSEAAMNMAFAKLEFELSSLSGVTEMLRKTIEYEITESEYILHCQVVCIEDIAEIREFEIN